MTKVDQSPETGSNLPFGTYEDAKAMVGTRSEVRFGDAEVNWAMIKLYCAVTEDANPSFWDEDFARQTWGGIVSPPGMLVVWTLPVEWRPGGGFKEKPPLLLTVPLPGDTFINVSTEMENIRPCRVGEHLNVVEELTDVSPEKTTRLGTGHFITAVWTIRNERGELVTRLSNTLFRFEAHAR